jgi:hypothetical protein
VVGVVNGQPGRSLCKGRGKSEAPEGCCPWPSRPVDPDGCKTVADLLSMHGSADVLLLTPRPAGRPAHARWTQPKRPCETEALAQDHTPQGERYNHVLTGETAQCSPAPELYGYGRRWCCVHTSTRRRRGGVGRAPTVLLLYRVLPRILPLN